MLRSLDSFFFAAITGPRAKLRMTFFIKKTNKQQMQMHLLFFSYNIPFHHVAAVESGRTARVVVKA